MGLAIKLIIVFPFLPTQLRKAMGLADENGHSSMGKLLKTLAEVNEIVSKGEDGEKMAAIHTEEGRQAIKHLEQARDPKGNPPPSV